MDIVHRIETILLYINADFSLDIGEIVDYNE